MIPKILIVDDDPMILRCLRRAIEAAGIECTVRTALGGEIALEVIDGGWVPDLAFIDLNMPLVSGRVVAERLAAVRGACVVIVFSATPPEPETVAMLYRIGVNLVMGDKAGEEVIAAVLQGAILPARPSSREFRLPAALAKKGEGR